MCFLRNELFSVLCVFFSFFFSLVFNTLYILESSLSLWSFFFQVPRPALRFGNETKNFLSLQKKIQFGRPANIFRIFPLSHAPCKQMQKKKIGDSVGGGKKRQKQSLKSFCFSDVSPKRKQWEKVDQPLR